MPFPQPTFLTHCSNQLPRKLHRSSLSAPPNPARSRVYPKSAAQVRILAFTSSCSCSCSPQTPKQLLVQSPIQRSTKHPLPNAVPNRSITHLASPQLEATHFLRFSLPVHPFFLVLFSFFFLVCRSSLCFTTFCLVHFSSARPRACFASCHLIFHTDQLSSSHPRTPESDQEDPSASCIFCPSVQLL